MRPGQAGVFAAGRKRLRGTGSPVRLLCGVICLKGNPGWSKNFGKSSLGQEQFSEYHISFGGANPATSASRRNGKCARRVDAGQRKLRLRRLRRRKRHRRRNNVSLRCKSVDATSLLTGRFRRLRNTSPPNRGESGGEVSFFLCAECAILSLPSPPLTALLDTVSRSNRWFSAQRSVGYA